MTATSRWALRLCIALCTVAAFTVHAPTTASAEPGDLTWWQVWNSSFFSSGVRVLVSDSGQVFSTGSGTTSGDDEGDDYLTVSTAGNGTKLWYKYYGGIRGDDYARDMAFGPNQHRVYVTGESQIRGVNSLLNVDIVTVAYRTDGKRLWVRRYDDAEGSDSGEAIATSAGTGRIFVVGSTNGRHKDTGMVTVAYSAAGEQLWTRRYQGSPGGDDSANHVLVSPSGHRIYVVGTSSTSATDQDITIIAYRGNGTKIWTRRYSGSDGNDTPATALLGPNGRHLYVAGTVSGDYRTVSYRRDGTQIWEATFDGAAGGPDSLADAALSPSGETLFVTGTVAATDEPFPADTDAVTVAYSSHGAELWTARHDSNAERDRAHSIAVSPDGNQVFVTGQESVSTLRVIAYNASGAEQWTSVFGSARGYDSVVAPDGKKLLITGWEQDVYEHIAVLAFATH